MSLLWKGFCTKIKQGPPCEESARRWRFSLYIGRDGTVVPLTFVPESDRNDQPGPSNLSPNAYASDIESAPNQTTELLNVSFISNDGNIVETEMTEIESHIPIYEVFQQPFTIPASPVHETHHDNELNESNNLSNVNLELAEELIRMAEKRENTFEKTFKERLLQKIKSDLRSRFYKQSAAQFLHETSGAEMLHDDNFLSWLANRLDYKTYRFRNLVKLQAANKVLTTYAFSQSTPKDL